MPQVGEISFVMNGDAGGASISRLRFTRQDSGNITGADVHSAAVAMQNVWGAAANHTPLSIIWQYAPNADVYDIQSGLVQGALPVTAPPTIPVPSGSGTHAAGVGARINWSTSTIRGRRFLRGATFMVPLTSDAFATNGTLLPASQTSLQAGITAYLTAMAAAALEPVVWHRPAKGQTSGGMIGVINSGAYSTQLASLRSRRQ